VESAAVPSSEEATPSSALSVEDSISVADASDWAYAVELNKTPATNNRAKTFFMGFWRS
jgi:hypothetical protein